MTWKFSPDVGYPAARPVTLTGASERFSALMGGVAPWEELKSQYTPAERIRAKVWDAWDTVRQSWLGWWWNESPVAYWKLARKVATHRVGCPCSPCWALHQSRFYRMVFQAVAK